MIRGDSRGNDIFLKLVTYLVSLLCFDILQANHLPEVVDIPLRILVTPILDGGVSSNCLDFPHQNFCSSVEFLIVGLRCICSSVELKIQLSIPSRVFYP